MPAIKPQHEQIIKALDNSHGAAYALPGEVYTYRLVEHLCRQAPSTARPPASRTPPGGAHPAARRHAVQFSPTLGLSPGAPSRAAKHYINSTVY
ncbi:hypothetical protein DEO72_LG3g1706 [Vigna unguiculata]|uniref:Uncharacterized protein n=1 Tax=Vigna unguiculata TaxID=3917 RepID=A0A4D6LEZ1_VIGUN|nr:hypothetical protein DEO72_LG3g1706 [Vigna unguiculata]